MRSWPRTRLVSVMRVVPPMLLVHQRVVAAACDQPAIGRKAARPATASANIRLPQNSGCVSPESIAPGITSSSALSTISMIVIESVSAAKASIAWSANRVGASAVCHPALSSSWFPPAPPE